MQLGVQKMVGPQHSSCALLKESFSHSVPVVPCAMQGLFCFEWDLAARMNLLSVLKTLASLAG